MFTPAGEDGFESVAQDLILLRPPVEGFGALSRHGWLAYALDGLELVRLAARGRLEVVPGRPGRAKLEWVDVTPTGVANLDRRLPDSEEAAARPRFQISLGGRLGSETDAYLHELETSGVLRPQRVNRAGVFRQTRWLIVDTQRGATTRARLDAVALDGGPVDLPQRALAGLVVGLEIAKTIYPLPSNRVARKRLGRIWNDAMHPSRPTPKVAVHDPRYDGSVREAIDVALHDTLRTIAAAGDSGGGGG
jgi:hypothetical protein